METNFNYFDQLPVEKLVEVLSFLNPKDLAQAAQVCKLWNNVNEERVLWEKHCSEEIKQFPEINFKEKLKAAVSKIQYVIQNENAVITLGATIEKRIFPEDLIEALKNPEKTIEEKLKLVDNRLNEQSIQHLFDSMPMIHLVLQYMAYNPHSAGLRRVRV